MRVYSLKSLSIVAIAVLGVLASQSDAQASWGASCGSWGGYSGSGGSWGGSWGGGSSGSWGGGGGHHQRRGLLHRIFHRHHNHGSNGSWGGSQGGYVSHGSSGSWGGSYGGSYGGTYGGSYGGSYGGAYGGVYEGGTVIGPVDGYESQGPAILPEGGETPEPPLPPTGDAPMTLRGGDAAAMLTVSVPADASVYVNDNPTRSTGELRHYVSRGLTPGAAYTYRVRAEFVRGGEVVSETKTVRLTAGGTASLAFSNADDDAPLAYNPVETKLTLHVPADAKVTLAGNQTQQVGGTRHFVTSHLASGEKWSDYVVRVEVERDGRIVAEEKVLNLVGGESRELVLDLDALKIAAR